MSRNKPTINMGELFARVQARNATQRSSQSTHNHRVTKSDQSRGVWVETYTRKQVVEGHWRKHPNR